MRILLLLAAIGQGDREACSAAANDIAFERAVEDFAGADAPEPYRSIFRRMGDRSWAARESASADALAAIEASPADRRWLFAGMRSRDPEVRVRCNAVGRRLDRCPSCNGDGSSRNWSEWPCYDCAGSGSPWPFTPFD